MSLDLTFYGAAGCVTGSCMRLETPGGVILVDCGMFQGSKTLKELNYQDFPFRAEKVDAVLLTHAHIDHSGLLPKLMKAGFRGPIWATAATRDLCEILLADSAGIQETEVEHLNRRNLRRGRPEVEPIYHTEDAQRVMTQFKRVKLGEAVRILDGVEAVYWEAGHILGSASIELRLTTGDGMTTMLFSGDLGAGDSDFSPDPDGPSGVDYLILESTYGDRERTVVGGAERRAMLADELNAAQQAGGPLLIPAFAVERSQELLADILTLMDAGEIPEADIFLDSPLAIKATKIFHQRGWNPAVGANPFESVRASERLKFLEKPWDSDTLDRVTGWHIIMAGSGMCDAGRIRKHLERWLWNRHATVLLAGFQAMGTLGRLLADGAQRVRIRGDEIKVAARIRVMDVYSGHADATALVAWAKARGPVRKALFLDHGEPGSLRALETRLKTAEGAHPTVVVAEMDGRYDLVAGTARAALPAPTRLAGHAPAALDWHNDRAALLGDLEGVLAGAASDEDRALILGRLTRALNKAEGAVKRAHHGARRA